MSGFEMRLSGGWSNPAPLLGLIPFPVISLSCLVGFVGFLADERGLVNLGPKRKQLEACVKCEGRRVPGRTSLRSDGRPNAGVEAILSIVSILRGLLPQRIHTEWS
jgi:hypothetical protein